MSKALSGINQKTFNDLLKAQPLLTEDEIKQKIGDLTIPWKDDTSEPVKTATDEQKLILYDKLRVFNLPFDWELRFERLKVLDKNQDSIDTIKTELKTWTDTFPEKKPQDVKDHIKGLEDKLSLTEKDLKDQIKALQDKLNIANSSNQQAIGDKDKEIKDLKDELKGWKESFGKDLGKAKDEYIDLLKRPDIPITNKQFWDDYSLRWTKEHSDKIEKDLKESQGQTDQFWKEKQALWRIIEKFLSDELKNKYIFAKPIITKEQAKSAIDNLLIDVEHKWSDYLEKNTVTPQNIMLGFVLTNDISKRPKALQVLDWIREVQNKQIDYQQLFTKWSGGDSYNKENDFDGGSLCLLANYLEKYLDIKNFGTPKVIEEV